MKRLLLRCGVTVLFLGMVTSAQTRVSRGRIQRVSEPLVPAHLDLRSGTLTRGKSISKGPRGTISTSLTWSSGGGIYSGFVGVDTGSGPSCEWFVRGAKSAGESGLMHSFTFVYCSSALGTPSGGPGAKVRIGFRSNYTLGGAAPTGTSLGSFNLSGLPANTTCSGVFGAFNCYRMTVGVGARPLLIPDGPIGYSWRFVDIGTAGLLAKTFPWLTCVQSCTTNGMWPLHGGAGPDRNGQINVIDRYCPPGTLKSSFTFASVPNGAYFTNVAMEIREYVPHPASSSTFGRGNAQTLVQLAQPIWNGSTRPLSFPYSLSLDCSGNGNSTALFRLAFVPGAMMQTRWGTVYVNLQPLQGLNIGPLPHTGNKVGFHIDVVPQVTLSGGCWESQGFCGDSAGTGRLSNALIQTLGTY